MKNKLNYEEIICSFGLDDCIRDIFLFGICSEMSGAGFESDYRLANDSSLESFRTQNMYLSGYWEYRTYRANRLPSLTMDLPRHNITGT